MSENKQSKNILLQLFLSTLYLSAFTFGGGYVIVSLLKQKFVNKLHWINDAEMLDLVAIAQSAPGPIAVNGAIAVGYRLAGLVGALVAVLGSVIPPFVIITLISFFYEIFKANMIIRAMLKGMTAGIGAVIISTTWDMAESVVKEKDIILDCLMVLAFIANFIFNVNVIYIILISIIIGQMRAFIAKNRKEKILS